MPKRRRNDGGHAVREWLVALSPYVVAIAALISQLWISALLPPA
jgi:hypothetical protein